MTEKTKEELDQEAKDEANRKLTAFHNVCNLYNEHKLDDVETEGETMLKVYHDIAKEAKEVIVFLFNKENCEATRAYMDFVARIIIRLSSLRHEGRAETATEHFEHVTAVRRKYGY